MVNLNVTCSWFFSIVIIASMNLVNAAELSSFDTVPITIFKFDVNKKQNTAVVTVSGGTEKLKLFNSKLRKLLKIGPDDSDVLGCEGCDKLDSASPPSEVVYVFPRKQKLFRSFGRTWNHVWYHSPTPYDADGALTMHFEFNNSDDPLCEEFQPPKCYYRSTCPAVGNCSRNKSGSCIPGCA